MKKLKSLSVVLVLLMLFSACSFTINIKGGDDEEIEDEVDEVEDISEIDDDGLMDEIEDVEEIENIEEILEDQDSEQANAPATVDDIKDAFMDIYPEWEEDKLDITINQSTETHASGGITFIGEMTGGGYFFAANTPDGWVIAADGNGTIDCQDIEPYDFPTTMIPECYDLETQEVVVR